MHMHKGDWETNARLKVMSICAFRYSRSRQARHKQVQTLKLLFIPRKVGYITHWDRVSVPGAARRLSHDNGIPKM